METENDKKDKVVSQSEQDALQDISASLEKVITHVGDMGVYQRFLFLAMMPFGIVWAFVYFSQMFITATPQEHWCWVPALEGLNALLRRNLSIPGAAEGDDYDHCTMYDANWTLVLETMEPPAPNTPTVPCRHGWEFLFEDIPYSTIVNEREWVCDRSSLIPWAQAICFMGSIAGGIILGRLADMFGRVPILVLSNLLGCLGGVATIFTSSFWDFSICRFIVGMSCDSCFLLMYILALEYVGIRHRTWVANIAIALFFGSGCLLLPWLAYFIADWRNLMLATSLPMLIAIVAPLVVPESTRWLVSKGKIDKALNILRRFERINGTKIPDDVLDEFEMTAKTITNSTERFTTLFKTPSLRMMMSFLVISFMSCALVFDGLIRLSENLGLDFFVTFTVTSATEIPSMALLALTMDRFGRRILVCVPMVLAGVLSFVAAFVPRGVIAVALAVAARFFTNMSYGAVIQWAPELLPTPLRASGASLVHVSGFFAAMLSPFVVYSERAWEGLPLLVVAGAALGGGLVALLLPETTGRAMPQTLADWQRLAAAARPCCRKTNSASPEDVRNEKCT